MSDTLSQPSLHELEAALQPAVEALQAAKSDEAVDVAFASYEAAWAAYSAYSDATAEERLWAPMRARIEAAAAGQPPIVQEAMRTGVSLLRMSLTDKERDHLNRARRDGLLVWDPNYMFRKPDRLICSPTIAFGGTHVDHETNASD